MQTPQQTFNKVLNQALLLCFGTYCVMTLIGKQAFRHGFVKGAIIACLNFFILYVSIIKCINKGYARAFTLMYISFILRVFLSLLVLYISLIKSYETFVATLLGLHVIKFVIFSNTIGGRWKKWSSFQK